MSGGSKTLEVDADELSDEVIEDLVEEGGIDEEKAEELGEEVWFEEVDVGETEETGALEYLQNRFKSGVEFGSALKDYFSNYKTMTVNVDSVERTNGNKVSLGVSNQRVGSGRLKFGTDSTKLANLLKWKGLENPVELEGESIPLARKTSRSSWDYVLIPHNVSTTGQLRFSLYNGVEEIREKTKIERFHKNPESLFMGSAIGLIIGFCSLIPAVVFQSIGLSIFQILFSVPIVAVILFILFVVAYVIFRLVLRGSRDLLNSSFHRKRI